MNINITLFGEMITFAILVWITMKFIWPNLMTVLTERENKISQGLQAAEKGQQKLVMAEAFAKRREEETKRRCTYLLAQAKKQAEQIVETAVIQAASKKEEIIQSGYLELEKIKLKLIDELKGHLSQLIIVGAEKILESNLDPEKHQQILLEISDRFYGTK